MDSFYTPKESINSYANKIEQRLTQSKKKVIAKAIFAGAMIAIGASASSVACHNIANVGISRLVAGMVFPCGLMMVILLGAELFTGDCMLLMEPLIDKANTNKVIRFLGLVFAGNLVGALVISLLVYFSGQLDYSSGLLGAYTIKVAVAKTSLSFGKALASGILCNILVCAAVLMALCAKDVTGKLLVSFFVIMAFVVSGYEHCVANMYYIIAGIMCKANPEYVSIAISQYSLSNADIANLNVGTFFINNLLPVTIGNILGGSLFFAIPLFLIYRSKPSNITSISKTTLLKEATK